MAAPTLSEAPRREKCVSRNWSAVPLTALPTVKASVTVTVSSFFLASGSRFDLDTSPRPTPGTSQNLRLPSSQSKSHRGYFKYTPPPPLRDHVTMHTTLNQLGHGRLGGGKPCLEIQTESWQWGLRHAGRSKFIAGLEAWPGLCLESSVVQLTHKSYHLNGDTGLLTLTPP